MKKLVITAIVAGQMISAQPAFAAELTDGQSPQVGAFGGVRVRVPLDGNAQRRPVRAGLTIAPTLQTRNLSGETRTRVGEGREVGLAGDAPLRVSLGGTPVSQLAEGPQGPDGRRAGVSTLGWVAIGAGAAVLVVFGLYAWLLEENSDCDPGEC